MKAQKSNKNSRGAKRREKKFKYRGAKRREFFWAPKGVV